MKFTRFDKRLVSEDFYLCWEIRRIGYVGKLKWTQSLAREEPLVDIGHAIAVEESVIEVITLLYKATSWNQRRRVAIIRKARTT